MNIKAVMEKRSNLLLLLLLCTTSMLQAWPQDASAVIIPSYVEDFNVDTDLSSAGFSDSVFVHSTDSSASTFLTSGGVATLAGESEYSLFMNGGLDPQPGHTITFDLAPREVVTQAAIWNIATLGALSPSRLTWYGTLGTAVSQPVTVDAPSTIFAVAADLATFALRDNFYIAPMNIGYITAVGLNGHDTVWDHLMIVTTTVPVPATAWLFGSGLIGLIGIARRKRI